MATAVTKVETVYVEETHLEKTINFVTDHPCLLVFDKEDMFNRKYVILQKGSNLLPYFEGKGHYWNYPLEILDGVIPSEPLRPLGHDVPIPVGKTLSIAAGSREHDVPVPWEKQVSTDSKGHDVPIPNPKDPKEHVVVTLAIPEPGGNRSAYMLRLIQCW